MKDLEIKEGETLFKDDKVCLYAADPTGKRKVIYEGPMSINDKELVFGEQYQFVLKDLEGASVIRGDRFNFTYGDHLYLVVGPARFNPLKYVFAFHRLETGISINNLDLYFTLED